MFCVVQPERDCLHSGSIFSTWLKKYFQAGANRASIHPGVFYFSLALAPIKATWWHHVEALMWKIFMQSGKQVFFLASYSD